MACEDIGNYQGEPRDFVTFVLAADLDGSCQRVQVGTTSPGPIDDNETLARFVFVPTHVSKDTGAIDESLVSDAFKFGASVNRAHIDWEQALAPLHQNGEAQAEQIRTGSESRAPQPDRRYLGVVRLVAGEARAISVDGSPARIRVYDTSRPNEGLHGDIVANAGGLEKAMKKQLRVLLYLHAIKSGLFLSPLMVGEFDSATLGIALHAP